MLTAAENSFGILIMGLAAFAMGWMMRAPEGIFDPPNWLEMIQAVLRVLFG